MYGNQEGDGTPTITNEEQIKILQNEGNLAPVQEYTVTFDGDGEIPLSFSDNALLLVELERID